MEINLDNPTADQITALKAKAPGLAEQLGLIDPGTALTSEQAEAIQFAHKINGVDVVKTVADWTKDASKGEGADAKFREAQELAKKAEGSTAIMEAQNRFRAALAAKQMPAEADIKVMADSLGVPVDGLMASIENESEPEPKPKDKGGKETMEPFKLGPNMITLDMLPADLRDDIAYLREQKGGAAQSELDKMIQKSLDNDKTVATLIEKHGGSEEQKTAFKESLFENAKLRTEGRIQRMPVGAIAADLTRAIEESVVNTAVNQEKAGIPEKAAPQPIIMGPSEPGGQEVRILSDAKVPTDLPMDHPDYVRNQSLIAAQTMAKSLAKEAASSE